MGTFGYVIIIVVMCASKANHNNKNESNHDASKNINEKLPCGIDSTSLYVWYR